MSFYRLYDLIPNNDKESSVEICYYISTKKPLSEEEYKLVCELLSDNELKETSHALYSIKLRYPNGRHLKFHNREYLSISKNDDTLLKCTLEIGPKLHYQSVWCTNVMSILHKLRLSNITRVERSEIYIVDSENAQNVLNRYDKMTQTIYLKPLESFEQNISYQSGVFDIPISKISLYNQKKSLGFDKHSIQYYTEMYKKLNRNPTNVELYDLSQSNSEHSRHHLFRGDLYIQVLLGGGGEDSGLYLKDENSLMDYIKKTIHSKTTNKNSIVGIGNFPDNSSAIEGRLLTRLQPENPSGPGIVECNHLQTNTLFTAETHNFPTGIAPFPGAATGTGGRIRDVQAIGRGGQFVAGTAGYAVGCLGLESLSNIEDCLSKDEYLHEGWKILKEASDGASDYGNKIGEPLILGWCRSFGSDYMIKPPIHQRVEELRKDDEGLLTLTTSESEYDEEKYIKRIEWIKPIMFSGGIGSVYQEHIHKLPPQDGMLIIRIGGPAYRIGVGGGSASSASQSSSDEFAHAVQRGDPEMENRLDRFIRACVSMGEDNPILSIHDQGAGGPANVTKEIAENKGAIVDIGKMYIGDESLNSEELWVAEFQEQNTFLTQAKHLPILQEISRRENVDMRVIGVITNDDRFTVIDSRHNDNVETSLNCVVDFPLSEVLKTPKKTYHLKTYDKTQKTQMSRNPDLLQTDHIDIEQKIKMVFRNIAVGSKRFLTNKVDRSVSGLIAQQQCIGPLSTPLSNLAVISHSYFDNIGAATSIGERAIVGITNPENMARLAVSEMLTNLMWAPISSRKDIKCSVNWMWPAKSSIEKRRLYDAVRAISALMVNLGIGIDGGKDSLSMSAKTRKTNKTVDSPPQVVVSGYVECTDLSGIVTPNFKRPNNDIIYVDLSDSKYRLNSSVFSTIFNGHKDGDKNNKVHLDDVVDLDDWTVLANVFDVVQDLLNKGLIVSGHDRSDGGLISALSEMCISGCLGCDVQFNGINGINNDKEEKLTLDRLLFSEELGILIEVSPANRLLVESSLKKTNAKVMNIGKVTSDDCLKLRFEGVEVLNIGVSKLREYWEHTSFEMEKLQSQKECVSSEMKWMNEVPIGLGQNFDKRWSPLISEREMLSASLHLRKSASIPLRMNNASPVCAVIRAQGSNGDREMMAAFWMSGFDVWDVTMSDLIDKKIDINKFRCIAFVGGFSFADVLGSSVGWYSIIEHTPHLKEQFDIFYKRKDTCSLGVCNGFQLLARLGWLGKKFTIKQNTSKRFESRFSEMTIYPGLTNSSDESLTNSSSSLTNSVWLKDMSNKTFGIWVAHGEGRIDIPREYILENPEQFPLRYCDPANDAVQYTETYPCNPNGSPYGIAGMVSKDGRHFGLMPHPERCVKLWQLAWCPEKLKETHEDKDTNQSRKFTPWIKFFQGAYEYCSK